MEFKAEVFQNPYLACDANRVDAILTVTSMGTANDLNRRLLLEGLIIDTSGSMLGARLDSVKLALDRVLNSLPINSWFFVIGFGSRPRMLMNLCETTVKNKQTALYILGQTEARGDTVMSSAFEMARTQFAQKPHLICHAMFLTDGQNNLSDEPLLEAELSKCESIFQCDCRGVGTDWQPRQLQTIARKLLGTASIIPEPSGIGADFFNTVQTAMKRSVSNVRVRLWLPKSSHLLSIKQVSPEILSLTDRARQVDAQTTDFPTGAWAPESRDYHIAIAVPNGEPGDEILAARISLVYDDFNQEITSKPARIIAAWTEDDSLSTRMNEHVAHYTGQDELAEAIQKGLEMREKGYIDVATKLLGKAAKIAAESGNDATTVRLKKVVDIIDARTGTVRLKKHVAKSDAMDLDLSSTRTARTRPTSQ